MKHTVLDALRALSAVCDGARSEDMRGFNGTDSNFGKSLARQESLSPRQEQAAKKMLVKYRKQLKSYGIDGSDLQTSVLSYDAYIAQKSSNTGVVSAPVSNNRPSPVSASMPVNIANVRKAHIDGSKIVFSFPYDPTVKDSLKDAFRSARFDGQSKTWSVPMADITSAILWGKQHNFDVYALEQELIYNQAKSEQQAQQEDREYQARLGNVDLENIASGLVLREYQKDGIKALIRRKRAILADDMGLGKTLQALIAAKAWSRTHNVFVVAPISLHSNWRAESAKVDLTIEIYSWAKVPQAPEKPYVLIADEAHYAQNLKSARTEKLLELAEHASAVFLLTGTPIKNGRPSNLFPLLSACHHKLAKDRKAYEKRYCNAHATRFTAWDTTGSSFLDELNEKISDVLIRRTKKLVAKDLPEKTRILRQLELDSADSRLYDLTVAQLQSEYRERIAQGKISDEGEALVLLNHMRHAASKAKANAACDLAEELLEQGESVVLFFEFSESAEKAASKLQAHGVSLLTGDTKQSDRGDLVAQFQNGHNRVFIGTIKAGGVGLTLTASSNVLLVDRPWTPGDAVQAEDRIHRIGQNNACTAYWLRHGHIDERIDTILAEKAEKIGVVLGDDTVHIGYANLAQSLLG